MAKKKSFKTSLFILFLVVGVSFCLFYLWVTSPVTSNGQEKVFVVNRGEPTRTIAVRLKKEGLVKSSYLFIVETYRLGLMGKIQAGSFRLSQTMSTDQIVKSLTSGKLDQWLTVVEGLRREEIASVVEKELGIKGSDFLLASLGKEGSLFPDSYLVPVGSSAKKVVEMMLTNFDKKVAKIQKGNGLDDFSFDQLIVVASLVEREAKTDNDRQLVAGIIKKRLNNDWALQIDASSQYVKANSVCEGRIDCQWWPFVGSVDLKIDSPYNTYLNKGLPPQPICNPSLSSLEAVANSINSEYWFYLSDLSGKIHFSTTYEEHQSNIDKYLF